jgi:hypothetical protein
MMLCIIYLDIRRHGKALHAFSFWITTELLHIGSLITATQTDKQQPTFLSKELRFSRKTKQEQNASKSLQRNYTPPTSITVFHILRKTTHTHTHTLQNCKKKTLRKLLHKERRRRHWCTINL